MLVVACDNIPNILLLLTFMMLVTSWCGQFGRIALSAGEWVREMLGLEQADAVPLAADKGTKVGLH